MTRKQLSPPSSKKKMAGSIFAKPRKKSAIACVGSSPGPVPSRAFVARICMYGMRQRLSIRSRPGELLVEDDRLFVGCGAGTALDAARSTTGRQEAHGLKRFRSWLSSPRRREAGSVHRELRRCLSRPRASPLSTFCFELSARTPTPRNCCTPHGSRIFRPPIMAWRPSQSWAFSAGDPFWTKRIAERSSQKLTRLDPEVLTALRLAAYQLLFLDRVPERAAVHESVELVKRARKRSAVPFTNAVLRKFAGSRTRP